MKVQFIPISQKADLLKRIEAGDKEASNVLIREIDRLESLIKDYEIVFQSAVNRYESDLNKTPAKIN